MCQLGDLFEVTAQTLHDRLKELVQPGQEDVMLPLVAAVPSGKNILCADQVAGKLAPSVVGIQSIQLLEAAASESANEKDAFEYVGLKLEGKESADRRFVLDNGILTHNCGVDTYRKKCRLMPACIPFREPVLVVACGGFHTAVLTDDGRVYSWGDGRSVKRGAQQQLA